jgi:hypothetical protein
MSLLANLATDAAIEDEKDYTGSNLLESGIYPSTIKTAYISKSDGGALGLVCTFKTDSGADFRQTFWMTSGTAKGAKKLL